MWPETGGEVGESFLSPDMRRTWQDLLTVVELVVTHVTLPSQQIRESCGTVDTWYDLLGSTCPPPVCLSLSFTLMEFSVIIIWDETRIIAKYIVAHLYANSVGLFTTMSVTFYIYQKLWKALIVTNKEASRDSAGCLVSDLKAARIEIITENVGTSHQSS